MAKNNRKFDNFDISPTISFVKNFPRIYYFLSKFVYFVNLVTILILLPPIILEILIFLLKKYQKIKINKNISIFYHWSFGHQIMTIDHISRIYNSENISLITFIYPRNNRYLYFCYGNIDTFIFESIFLKNKYKIHGDIQKYIFSILLKIFFYSKNIFNSENIYIKEKTNLRYYNANTKKIDFYTTNTIGYQNLIKTNKTKIQIPTDLINKVENEIVNKYEDFFHKPFVLFLLRTRRSLEPYDNARDSGSQIKYLKAIKRFIKEGYNVVGSGETKDNLFKNLKGYYDLSEVNLDKYILNLYLLFNSKKLICQHSGPLILTNILGIENIIINSFPFFLGSYNSEDKILFVKVKYRNKNITIDEIYKKDEHKNFRYGDLSNKNYKLEECSENEIYNAIFSDDYYKLNFPKDMLIYHTKNHKICKHNDDWLRE